MKKSILFSILMLILLWSCNSEDSKSNPVEGTWKLVEINMDPGDGSGTFQPVTSNKTITFSSNGTFTSNGELCDLSITTNQNSSGTYVYNASQKTMIANNCGLTTVVPSPWKMELTGNNILIISFSGCTESCQQKYEKQ